MRLAVIQMVSDAQEWAASSRDVLLAISLVGVNAVAACLICGVPCDIPLALTALVVGIRAGIGRAVALGAYWQGKGAPDE